MPQAVEFHKGLQEIEAWKTEGNFFSVVLLKHKFLISSAIFILLLVIGMYLPSSINGQITLNFQRGAEAFLVALFFLLFLLNGLSSPVLILFSLSLPLILVLATLTSPLHDIAPGVAIYYVPFSLMLCLNLRRTAWSGGITVVFVVVNIVNLSFNVLTILDIKAADSLLLNLYSSVFPELLTRMVIQYNKPVLSFALHSVAALMYFLFFVCNVSAYKAGKGIIYLFFAIGYFISCFFLYSNTAFFIIFFMLIFVLYKFIPRNGKSLILSLITAMVFFVSISVSFIVSFRPVSEFTVSRYEKVEEKLTSKVNGLYGRYRTEGGQSDNILYALDNPFQPAGFRKNEEIHYRDSGIVEYFVRGSFGLLMVIYIGFFLFLFVNLRSKTTAMFLFIVVVAAEAGFSYMCYPRFQYLLPVFIVFLNSLEKKPVPVPS